MRGKPARHRRSTWKDAPAGTKSFALVMDDPDVTQMPGGFVHWVLIDIPGKTTELPEGYTVGSIGVAGNMGMRRPGYMGPCPPTGAHHYHFKLYALDVETLGLARGATRADVEKALAEHKPLAMAETIGLYQKQAEVVGRVLCRTRLPFPPAAAPGAIPAAPSRPPRRAIDCTRFIPVRA